MGVGAAILGGAAISAVGSGIASSNAAGAAKDAAQTQADAANQASANQMAMFHQTQANLQPWITTGQNAQSTLAGLTGTNEGGNPLTAALTKPFNPTMEDLEATPGYQFIKDQGMKGVQNSYAAKGLGSSGAALKGGANYAEGLAANTFQQQFANYLSQNQQIYNMVSGVSTTGQNAAAGVGSLGQQATAQAGNFATSGANALAAGDVGAANALTSGLSGIGNSASNAALMYALNKGGMFGGSPPISGASANPMMDGLADSGAFTV